MNRNKEKSIQDDEFGKLPLELQIKTAKSLSNRDLVNLAQTSSKYHLTLFKPMIDVRKLLYDVARGEHKAVEAILKQDMSLIFKRGKTTDYFGRTFDNVSSFEYALWGLDKHMWAVMIACIPQNEEGRKVFAQLLAQYNKANTDGVIYRLNGKTITEPHFDFKKTIIKELQTQVDSIKAPGARNWATIDKQWQEGVGGAQKVLPMHVVNEYCSNEPFYPVPKFISQPKSSKQFFNWATAKYDNWFDFKLAADFAIYKGGAAEARTMVHIMLAGHVLDLDAMTALYEVRTKDFINLKSQLEKQATLDNHHQVVPMTELTACR